MLIIYLNKNKCKECYLKYKKIKDKVLQFKFPDCNKDHEKEFYEKLNKQFANTYKFGKVFLEVLTDIDMLLIVEKNIGGGICYSI